MFTREVLRSKRFQRVAFGLALLLGVGYFLWPAPNAFARSLVRSVLLTRSTPQQLLEQLDPYVKTGDRYADVHRRLSPSPSRFSPVTRPTEWALGLSDVHLVLAIHADGRVVGIGRYRNDVDDETIWLAGPNW